MRRVIAWPDWNKRNNLVRNKANDHKRENKGWEMHQGAEYVEPKPPDPSWRATRQKQRKGGCHVWLDLT
ncbi:hypothetical protein Bca4012_003065 [Brassica carinata]|uniref:(rape) hypothetical protein n=1 Tax=Brassica napus TaxID=3708 RepID=A0A816I6U0_BRANA|nr:unnamed protein product [Brassica napus]